MKNSYLNEMGSTAESRNLGVRIGSKNLIHPESAATFASSLNNRSSSQTIQASSTAINFRKGTKDLASFSVIMDNPESSYNSELRPNHYQPVKRDNLRSEV